MSDMTAEQFAQLAYQLDLVSEAQLSQIWAKFRNHNPTRDEFIAELQRADWVTNFQTGRLLEGRRDGYFYGDWKVLYMVGAGTFARVFRGVHRHTGEVRAVKVLRKRYSDDPHATDLFVHEAKLVMKLKHPNIVPVYEVEQGRNGTYMIMEFVEGRNLRDYVKFRTNFDLEESIRIGLDIAAGMDFAYMHGVPHRDMKLSNILLATNGRAMLVDFGLAAMEQKSGRDGMTNPRSVDYVALEKLTNVPKGDKRSDIYFLGAVLYQIISGKSPWPENMDRLARVSSSRFTETRPLAEIDPKIPNRVSSIISRAMELAPDKRYQQPGELKRDLETTLDMIRRGVLEQAPVVGSNGTGQDYEGDGRTVMLIDNHAEMQDLLRDGLKKQGYRVLIIANPERALDRFSDGAFHVDAVLINATRLGATAVETAKSLASGEVGGASLPIIILVTASQADLIKPLASQTQIRSLVMPVKLSQIRKTLLDVVQKSPA